MEKVNIQLPPPPETEFKIVSLDLIDDPERPMRHDLSPESVEEFVMSIRQVGIIEPLVVKPVNRDPDARDELLAGVLRRLPHRAPAREPGAGAARPVRRAHLPAARSRRHVRQAVELVEDGYAHHFGT